MAINKSEQMLEKRLINIIENLQREVIRLKSSLQPLGADMLDIRVASDITIGPVTLAAGQVANLAITTTPTSDFTLTIINHIFSVYVDVLDSAHVWRNGTSLTSGQKLIDVDGFADYETSELSGTYARTYKILIKNNDVVTHDCYVKYAIIMPKLSVV